MSKYFTNTLPVEILKALARLNAVSDTAWELVESAKEKGNLKSQTDALRLCKDTARDITEIVTNNRSLIDTAYEITDQKEKELSELVSSSYYTRVVADTVTKTNSGVCDNSSSSCKNDSSAPIPTTPIPLSVIAISIAVIVALIVVVYNYSK